MPSMSAAGDPSAGPARSGGVRLLGVPRLLGGARQTPFAAERRFQLLSILAVQAGHWVPRDRLAALLWPDREAASARGNLRTVIHRARELPGTEGLEVGDHALRWQVACDVAEFEAAAARRAHDEALALYGGALLEGLDDDTNAAWAEWLDAARSRLAALWHAVACEHLGTLQAPGAVAALAQRMLAVDPLDEVAFEARLRAEMALGHGAQARRLFRAHSERLAEELGVEPSRALRTLMHEAGDATRAVPGPEPHVQPANVALRAGGFVGRRRELAEVNALLARPECRWLSLLGPGGVGKSRLAREAMTLAPSRFAGGVTWVDLQDLQQASEFATRLAHQMNLGSLDEKDPVAHLAKRLPVERSLVVLDNAEHLEGLGALLRRLVDGSPGVCVLLTSRVRMNEPGEWVMPLEGLAVPDADEEPEAAVTFDAIQLFARRAREADPRFDLCAHAGAVAALARQVAGMPLALELAAGWVRLMTPTDIVEDLEGSLDLLERHPAESAAAPARPDHASLRAVIGGSVAMMAESERQALWVLSVFQGGFTREAARAMSMQGRAVLLPLLATLADKSLLAAQADGRYGLHPLVQAYAAGRLAEDPVAQARARDEHAGHFARYMASLSPLARTDIKRLVQAVDPELGNVRAAWQQALATRRANALGDMGPALTKYFEMTGRFSEGIAWLRPAVDALSSSQLAEASAPPQRVPWALTRLRHGLAGLLHRGGHQADSFAVAEAGLAGGIVDGDLEAYLGCLTVSASSLWAVGRVAEAHERHGRAVVLAREHQDRHCIGLSLGNVAVTHQARGETAQAVACIEEALAIARELGNAYLVGIHLINLSVALGVAGDREASAASWRETIAHTKTHGLHHLATHSRGGLAGALFTLGRLDEAQAEAQMAMEGARTIGNFMLLAWMLGLLARVDIARARYAPAIAALREAGRVGRQHGLQVDLLRTARHYAMVRAGQGQRLEAARMLRLVLSHPRLPPDAAQNYAPDLSGLNLSPEEQRRLDEAPPLTLDEVLAQIDGDNTRA